MQAFEKEQTVVRANCLPYILEQELQRNPFDGFFYPLKGLSTGVSLGSTQVRFSHPSPKYAYEITWFFYCDSLLKTKNASEIIYRGCSKFKTYSVFVCTGRVYDFDVFQIRTHARAGVRKTAHHFTLLNQVL